MDCIFCRIASGEVPTQYLHEDREIVAFPDINPQAPTHILIMPKEHFTSLGEMVPKNSELLGRLLLVAHSVAGQAGVVDTGFRLVLNQGRDGAQTVPHLHLHLMGGRGLSGRMG
ncbi:MAG: histidine triad nucleotide-binding protein [Dehalococcoidia bacterium]